MRAIITVERRRQNHKVWYVLRMTINGQESYAGYFTDRVMAFEAARTVTAALDLAGIESGRIEYEHGE